MTAGQAHQPVSAEEADQAFACLERFETLLLAVSGGPDSLALLYLVAEWAKRKGLPTERLFAATVDHQLRNFSEMEARFVAERCAELGLLHSTLRWIGPKPFSGVAELARTNRYRLLCENARAIGGSGRTAILTAHTLDDQAETVLMRLKRGSGVEGLASIPMERALADASDIRLVRPLLAIEKSRLIATLEVRGQTWCEDPTNSDVSYERVRVRRLMENLKQSGVTAEALARTARRMSDARDGLAYAVAQFKASLQLNWNGGIYASLDRAAYNAGPRIVRQMVLADLIAKSGGASAAPELLEIESLVGRLEAETESGATLGGAMIRANARSVRIWREAGRLDGRAVALTPGTPIIWDARFRVGYTGNADSAITVAPLGRTQYEAIGGDFPGRLRPPAGAAYGLPAFFARGALLAVPSLGIEPVTSADFKGLHFTCDPIDR
ncbi:MAG: tRNA lysidine(34) synthetase TilS [Hyphomicrobium sp.]|nr:tRNA lysidine(34) synthetase TilS [Hyphomicrobium sp.]